MKILEIENDAIEFQKIWVLYFVKKNYENIKKFIWL